MNIFYSTDALSVEKTIIKQGYREIDGRGFGYFISEEALVDMLQKQSLDPTVVIGLEYDESDFRLHDVSERIRKELSQKLNASSRMK